MAELLPRHHSEFSSKAYWDSFFLQRSAVAFEWYGEYSQLRSYVLKALTSENNTKVATILNIGCGNSNFSARLAVDGYDTTNIDFSDVVITEMQLKYPLMTYELMDMTKLSYPNSSFDVVIDKGSLDALMSDDTEDTRQQAYRMFQHIERVLTDQGAYICISLGQDYILTTLLEYFAVNSQAWTIEISLVVELVDNPLIPMVFVFKKKQTTAAVNNTGLCLNFDSLGTPLGAPVSLTVENTFTRITALQDYHVKQHSLLEIKLDRFEQLDFFADLSLQASESGDRKQDKSIPKFSIIVFDYLPIAKRLCAAFFVPQGRESDFQFSTAQGLKEVALQAECCRLLVIRCNRPHSFAPMSQLQVELSPLLMSLKPINHSSTVIDDFPFLALDIANVWSSIHVGSSTLSGDYCIEEQLFEEESKLRRRLIFLNNQSLVQTEVQLVPRKKGSKKKKQAESSPPVVNLLLLTISQLQFDGSYADDHLRAMIVSLVLAPNVIKKAHNGVSAAVIGLGGGALIMLLQRYLPVHFIDAIDIEPAMKDIGVNYFALELSASTKVITADGLDYLSALHSVFSSSCVAPSPPEGVECLQQSSVFQANASKGNHSVDLIIFDVDCKDGASGVTAPPPAFITVEVLTRVHSLLDMEGMLLLNVACRAEEYLNEVVSNLQTVFGLSGQVLELRPSDEDRNRIVIATKTRAGQSPENRERLLAKWIKSVGDEGDRLQLRDLLPLIHTLSP